MITLLEYFGKPHTEAQRSEGARLISSVNALVDQAVAAGVFAREVDPDTGCEISGSSGGDGDGGFRTPASSTGAPVSSHREAKAVDVYDPSDALDRWISEFEDGQGGNSKLAEHGLYREAPNATVGWCHLTTRPPSSGCRTFMP